MALATYSDLKTAITDWQARNDLSTKADDFIDLAEAFFNVKFRQMQMEKEDTMVTVADTATVNLPSDYLAMIKLCISDDPSPLELVSLKFIDDRYQKDLRDRPRVYAFNFDEGTPRIKLGATPDAVYTININYFYGIPALSDSNTTNWLLTKFPNLYLSGCLYEACKYIKDFEQAALFASEVNTLLTVFEDSGRKDRVSQQRVNAQVIRNVV